MSNLVSRNAYVGTRRTSFRMESFIWDSIREICLDLDLTLPQWLLQINDRKEPDQTLSSAVRVAVVAYYRDKAVALQAATSEHPDYKQDAQK